MKKAKKIFLDYSLIVVGTFILAFAIAVFLNKVELSTGGVSGIATVLNNLPIKIPLWATTLSINVVLFVFGFKMLPKSSILNMVVGIALFP